MPPSRTIAPSIRKPDAHKSREEYFPAFFFAKKLDKTAARIV